MAVLASFVERVCNTSSGFCVVATKVSFVVSCHPNWHWFQTRLCRATHYMVWFNHVPSLSRSRCNRAMVKHMISLGVGK
jgi:hypothetical protein